MVHVNAVTRATDGLLVSFGRILAPEELRRRRLRATLAGAADGVGVGRAAVRAVSAARSARWRHKAQSETTEVPVPQSRTAVMLLPDGDPAAARPLLLADASGGVPAHNVMELGDLVLVNDSGAGDLVAYNRQGMREAFRVRRPGQSPWPRGMMALPDGQIAVGNQRPAAVHIVDVADRRVVRSIELDGQPNETVYAIVALPDAFGDLPGDVLFAPSAAVAG